VGVLQVFAEFYEKADVASIPVPGDIYWVPSPAVDEVPRILDVRRADPVTHEILEYEILQIHGRHFTERADRLPIKLLPLTATEELVVAKAKKRPCVTLREPRSKP
jgi:hypothetical protein